MAATNVLEIPIVQALLGHPLPEPSKEVVAAESTWQDRAQRLTPLNLKQIEEPLAELDKHLTLRTYLVGYTLSKCDLLVWGTLRANRVAHSFLKQGLRINLSRWFTFIEESNPWIDEVVSKANEQARAGKDKAGDDGGSFEIGLQDTSKGVVTRFPPEPSGYLHIGHAKAALLNNYFAKQKYKGTLLLRFDDTNPSKEKQEFEDSIIEDLALMGVKADKTTHTSDYFQELYELCVQMIKDGKAYADDTPQEVMKEQRFDGIASKRRDLSVEESLAHFEEMKAGTEEGRKWFIRAKISVDDPNKALRDPVVYRCNPQPHHRTGDTWKIYPTYDLACPAVDAIENVTHALRTTEYNDRDAQYQWMIKAMKLRHVYNWNFSRLAFIKTFLSKRKLTKVVDNGTVWGWDDPRMPTVRGIRRRGMTIPALQEFVIKQGPSKNIVSMDWSSIWATNKKFIDPIAARYTAISRDEQCPATVLGARASPYTGDVQKHAKHPLGTKKVTFSQSIILDQEDAKLFEQDEEITLMNWGNAIVRKIIRSKNPIKHLAGLGDEITGLELELHLQGDVKKTKKKVTWLSTDQELIPATLYDFDHLLTKDKLEEEDSLEDFLNPNTEVRSEVVCDSNIAELKENDIIQIDRKGYFRVDKPFLHGQPAVMFQIPTGKLGTK